MKFIERLLVKMITIQLVLLILTQLFFHEWNSFPELQQLTHYEGVTENNITEVLETFNSIQQNFSTSISGDESKPN
ncbi:YpfB family protein [Niallia sp. XMNu-256]|uniref:YpfB family protein n=1 Tax=Niallia sp. XMNu-256 TaxID=3082444 RepID=UPI0030D624E8